MATVDREFSGKRRLQNLIIKQRKREASLRDDHRIYAFLLGYNGERQAVQKAREYALQLACVQYNEFEEEKLERTKTIGHLQWVTSLYERGHIEQSLLIECNRSIETQRQHLTTLSTCQTVQSERIAVEKQALLLQSCGDTLFVSIRTLFIKFCDISKRANLLTELLGGAFSDVILIGVMPLYRQLVFNENHAMQYDDVRLLLSCIRGGWTLPYDFMELNLFPSGIKSAV